MLLKIIRRLLISLFLIALSQQLIAEPLNVDIIADAAIMINADTGAILYEKNSRESHFPASITKIATALYTLQLGVNLDDAVTAEQESIASISPEQKIRANYKLPSHWVEVGSTHIGIKAGETLSMRDLLHGLMLASGNDAANVIAQHVSGTIPTFTVELNEYIKKLGCKDTNFTNPHGLHHPDHRTTAYDMALITREALKNDTFCEIVSALRYTKPKTNKQEATTLVQKNRLLRSGQYYYPKAFGVKIGYTTKALHTFVASAKHEGRTLIVVILHNNEVGGIFKDSIKLLDAAFNQGKVQRVLLKSGPQKYALNIEGGNKPVMTYLKDDISIEYYPAEEPTVKALIFWDELKVPVEKDQRVGELHVIDEQGQVLKKATVLAQQEVVGGWSLLSAIPSWTRLLVIFFVGIALLFLLLRLRR